MEYYNEELKFRKKQMLTLTISIQYHIGSLSHRNQTRKRNERYSQGKGNVKLSLFADEIITLWYSSQHSTQNLLELVN